MRSPWDGNPVLVFTERSLLQQVFSTTAVPAKGQEKLIQIDGSSTVFPITEAVAAEFQNANRGKVNVTVGISGTGGGYQEILCWGKLISLMHLGRLKKRKLSFAKRRASNLLSVPVAYDALTVVVNPQNSWAAEMSVDELRKMWEQAAPIQFG